MGVLTKTRAIGGSLVVTIPKELIKLKSINEGEIIEIEVKKHKIDGFGMFKGMKPFSKEDRLQSRV